MSDEWLKRLTREPADPLLASEDEGVDSETAATMVTRLFEIASWAREGKVEALAVAAILDDGSATTLHLAPTRIFALLGTLEYLKQRLIAERVEEPGREG